MKLTQLFTTLSLVGSVTVCNAFSLETGVSTLGLGITATQHIYGDFSAKINVNDVNIAIPYNGKNDDLIQSHSNIDLFSYGLILDYHVWKGLNIETGAYKLDGATSTIVNYSGKYKIFIGKATDNNRLEFNQISPYLGLNYKTNLTKNLYLSTTAGVIFTTVQPRQTVDANISSLAFNDHISYPQASRFLTYPVLGITIGYTF